MLSEQVNQLLKARRDQLEQLQRQFEPIAQDDRVHLGVFSEVDKHPGEGGTESLNREAAISLLGQIATELQDVDEAEGRLTQGTYGLCAICGGAISDERLEAMPETRLCVEDAGSKKNAMTVFR